MAIRNIFLFLLLPIVIGVFNIFINPFDQWPIPRLGNINDKITETRWDPLIKSYQVKRGSYDSVILGSSRAAITLSPRHPAFASDSTYNYGLSGAGIYFQYLALQHAIATQPIKKIIITPDFFGFNAYLALNQPGLYGQSDVVDVMTEKSGAAKIGQATQAISNTFANNLGWRGTNSSLRTLIAQNQKTVYIDDRGFWNRFGTKDRNFTAQFDRTERTFLTVLLFPFPARQYAFSDVSHGYDSFVIYRNMLMLAQQHHIQVTLIVLPIPARDMVALQLLEQWPNYVRWKKMLVEINESVANDTQSSPFAVWDFEDINNEIESDHVADLKPFFFEPFHPTPLVGERILNRVFIDCAALTCWPGQQLSSTNVSASLATMENGLLSYKTSHPQQMSALMENINKTAAYRSGKE